MNKGGRKRGTRVQTLYTLEKVAQAGHYFQPLSGSGRDVPGGMIFGGEIVESFKPAGIYQACIINRPAVCWLCRPYWW
jgi:hypothetical protein